MIAKLYSITHDTFGSRGYPWAWKIVEGLELVMVCRACASEGRRIRRPIGEVAVELEKDKGTRWPDALGCGAWPLFIVSRRVLDDWQTDGIGVFPANRVKIVGPLPEKLKSVPPPEYFWLDGMEMEGGKLDFDASGFVGVRFCPECGTRMDDVAATAARQRSGEFPLRIKKGTWNRTHVFTTDLSPAAFFCTGEVMACAQRRKHSNLRFVPGSEIE